MMMCVIQLLVVVHLVDPIDTYRFKVWRFKLSDVGSDPNLCRLMAISQWRKVCHNFFHFEAVVDSNSLAMQFTADFKLGQYA